MTQPLQRLAELPKTAGAAALLPDGVGASGEETQVSEWRLGGGWGMWAGLGGISNLPFSVWVLT